MQFLVVRAFKFKKQAFVCFFLLSVFSFIPPSAPADESRKIATVVPRGSFIYAYDEKGSQLFALSAGGGEKDGLVGYTATTVSVRRGSFIYVYNEKGTQISAIPAGN